MTPKELYEWAENNHAEDSTMVFCVNVGNETVELDIDQLFRPTNRFEIIIDLF